MAEIDGLKKEVRYLVDYTCHANTHPSCATHTCTHTCMQTCTHTHTRASMPVNTDKSQPPRSNRALLLDHKWLSLHQPLSAINLPFPLIGLRYKVWRGPLIGLRQKKSGGVDAHVGVHKGVHDPRRHRRVVGSHDESIESLAVVAVQDPARDVSIEPAVLNSNLDHLALIPYPLPPCLSNR